MLMAITIAWDDAGKKLSKRRPETPQALDSSSREVDSRVEALRFDRRAGALGAPKSIIPGAISIILRTRLVIVLYEELGPESSA